MKETLISDEYAYSGILFICLVSILFWGYHRYKYSKSGYQEFDYYLNGKSIKDWVIVTEVLLAFISCIAAVCAGAYFIHYLIY